MVHLDFWSAVPCGPFYFLECTPMWSSSLSKMHSEVVPPYISEKSGMFRCFYLLGMTAQIMIHSIKSDHEIIAMV